MSKFSIYAMKIAVEIEAAAMSKVRIDRALKTHGASLVKKLIKHPDVAASNHTQLAKLVGISSKQELGQIVGNNKLRISRPVFVALAKVLAAAEGGGK